MRIYDHDGCVSFVRKSLGLSYEHGFDMDPCSDMAEIWKKDGITESAVCIMHVINSHTFTSQLGRYAGIWLTPIYPDSLAILCNLTSPRLHCCKMAIWYLLRLSGAMLGAYCKCIKRSCCIHQLISPAHSATEEHIDRVAVER